MKSNCETKEEYNFSKRMFVGYIQTHCKTVLGIPFTDPLLVWFRNSVETLESNFCYWRRSKVRHYDEYTNSIHEGTNNALKHRPGAVVPRLSLKNAVSKISFFADVDINRTKSRAAYEYLTESPHMRVSATSWLTITAEKMINKLQDIKHKYAVHHQTEKCWLCVRHPDFPKPPTNCKYPVFKRIRRIIYENGRLVCSCPFQHTYGLPCVHLLRVLDTIPNYTGISHHDVSVSWWKLYHLMIFECTNTDTDDSSFSFRRFLKLLLYIKQHEQIGIAVPKHFIDELQPSSGVIEEFFCHKEGKMYCWNYSDDQLEAFNSTPNTIDFDDCPPGLSQTSVIHNVEDDNDILPNIFQNVDGIPLAHETAEACHVRNPYGFLKPYFTQMIDSLEGNCTMEELVNVKNTILQITNAKRRAINDSRKNNGDGEPSTTKRTRYMSSNVVSETKRKTHGTKHY